MTYKFVCNKYINLVALLFFITLLIRTIFLTPDNFAKPFTFAIPIICIICCLWTKNIYSPIVFYFNLILFSICSIEAFLTDNIFLLFTYIESTIIPMYYMIISEESSYNKQAIYNYIIYSFISACIVLFGLIVIFNETSTMYISKITNISKIAQYILLLGCSIKIPMFPFHYWLPIVHGKSPTLCSVLLASVVLKFAPLILVRFSIHLEIYSLFLIFGIFLSSYKTYFQKDLKTIFAYSSIIHMNSYLFVIISGLRSEYFAFNLVQHSFTMSTLFLIVDMIKRQAISRLILLICFLIAIDIPGTWGFMSEAITVKSITNYNKFILILYIISLILFHSRLIFMYFYYKDIHGNMSKLQKICIFILLSIIVFSYYFYN